MRIFKIFLLFSFLNLSLFANADKPKQTLQANYFVNYKILPPSVKSISEIFTEGMIYGRLRTNWFFISGKMKIFHMKTIIY